MTKRDRLSTEPYKGVRDFYPEDWKLLQSLFSKSRRVLELNGYEEYNASPLEYSELYLGKGAANAEIVEKQSFTFTDRGERSVTLRPEMTPTLARMVAAKGPKNLALPLRWFSIGNRFRYENVQKGRRREFYQVDVDLLGLLEGEADIEIIALAHDLLTAFGAKTSDFTIRLNSRSVINECIEALGVSADKAQELIQLLDRKDKMSADEFETAIDAIAGTGTEARFKEEHARRAVSLTRVIDQLTLRGIQNVVVDHTLVRGFDYYTGIVFEIFDTDPANARALFGGGRYDNLTKLFSNDEIPGVGFAFGDVTLLDFLETHGLSSEGDPAPVLYIATEALDDVPRAQLFARDLHALGVPTFVNLSKKSDSDQYKDAQKRRIRFFMTYRKDLDPSALPIKDLVSGETSTVASPDIATFIQKLGQK